MLQHSTADHLPRVLPVGQHDALVHDHSLRGLRGGVPGHPDDVEVCSLVGVRGGGLVIGALGLALGWSGVDNT